MVERDELARYCAQLLDCTRFSDYCPNGLQVEGRTQIRRLLVGVTACEALLVEAERWEACAVLVHHGYFWRGEPQPLVGMKGRRVARLFRSEQNLFAYHLPLDAHPVLGNNAQLAEKLGVKNVVFAEAGGTPGLMALGQFDPPLSLGDLRQRVDVLLGREPTVVGQPARGDISRLAICSGGAQGFLIEAAAHGVDAYLSGELSEKTSHEARELGLAYLAAGHHATERLGVQALGQHLADHFDLTYRFFEVDNPA